MLILAGVAIRTVTGENGLFRKSKEAVNTWKTAEEHEKSELDKALEDINKEMEGKETIVLDNFDKFSLTAVKKDSTATSNIDFNEEIKVDLYLTELCDYILMELDRDSTLEDKFVSYVNVSLKISGINERVESF